MRATVLEGGRKGRRRQGARLLLLYAIRANMSLTLLVGGVRCPAIDVQLTGDGMKYWYALVALFAPFVVFAQGLGATPAAASGLEEALPGFVELSPTKQFIGINLNAGTPMAKRFVVQDGVMNSLSTSSGERFIFIAKVDTTTNSIRLHKVELTSVVHNGQTKKMLRVGRPLTNESSGDELRKVGVNSVELTLADKPIPALQTSAERTKGGLCPEEPCSGNNVRCCNYTPCPPDSWGRFCTWGVDGGCGGDECGMCCT